MEVVDLLLLPEGVGEYVGESVLLLLLLELVEEVDLLLLAELEGSDDLVLLLEGVGESVGESVLLPLLEAEDSTNSC